MDRVAETLKAQVDAYAAYQAARYAGDWGRLRKARRTAIDAAAAAEAAQDEALAEILANTEQLALW